MKPYDPDYRLRGSLRPLVKKIASHWRKVNQALPPSSPLIVLDDMNVEEFSALPGALEPLNTALREVVLELRLAAATLRAAKRSLYARMGWFRRHVLADYPHSGWRAVLPVLPAVQAGADEFLGPARKMKRLWNAVASLPAVTPDGYGSAEFTAELAQVEALWDEVEDAELRERIAREELLVFYRRAAAAISAYGHAARSRLMPDAPLAASIPRLWG